MPLRPLALAALATLAPSPALLAQATVPPAPAARPAPAAPDAPGVTTAFVDATVVPMDRERLLAGWTVVVRDGRIVAMGPTASTPVPAGATRIDARGRFLAPGLADMHAHLGTGDGSAATPVGRQLLLSLATGVTTLRNMSAPPQATPLLLRERIARGELAGPTLVVFSPSLHGRNVASAAQARARVEQHAAAGYDGLKTHGMLPRETYDTLVAAARRAKLPLAGHVTPEVGLRHAMASGQQIEHMDGYLAALIADSAASAAASGQFTYDEAVLARVDTARIAALVAETRQAGVTVGPTVALFDIVAGDTPAESLSAWPELRYVVAPARTAWAKQMGDMGTEMPGTPAGRARYLALRRQLLVALQRGGVPLLAGSDSPQLYMTPGFGLHRELAAMVRAGLTPFEALSAATRAPAAYLGQEREFGTIAVGRRADLVLVDANPLADVGALRNPRGVMARGRWYDRAALDAMLAEVETAVR